MCIYKNYFNNNDLINNETNTQYLEYERTLPRVNNISCPNNECETNKLSNEKNKKNISEVVYVVINKKQMIFQYKCCKCLTTWKNK